MKLIKVMPGKWIDPSTVVSVTTSPQTSPMHSVSLDMGDSGITFFYQSSKETEEDADRIAQLINAATQKKS